MELAHYPPPALPPWLEALLPFTRRFVGPPAHRLHFVDNGPESAQAVLCIHGNPTWSFFYRSLLKELSGSFRLVVPDHLGCGLSDKPAQANYSIEAHIERLIHLVEALALPRFHLVLHDWGGPIGLGLARRRPELIDRIAMMNTAAFLTRRMPQRIRLARTRFPGELLVRGFGGFERGLTWFGSTSHLPSTVRRAYRFPYAGWSHRRAIYAFIRAIPRHPGDPTYSEIHDTAAALPQIDERHRTLLLWGTRDWCFDGFFYDRMRERLPHAEAEALPRAGHLVLEDAPVEAPQRIHRFLSP